jgi:beta-lactamase regulating signal transducer with metallopeptidase domain
MVKNVDVGSFHEKHFLRTDTQISTLSYCFQLLVSSNPF